MADVKRWCTASRYTSNRLIYLQRIIGGGKEPNELMEEATEG